MKKFSLFLVTTSVFAVTAIPALADNSTSTAAWAKLNGTCMQSAVETRDTAITASMGAYSSAAISALNARKNALEAAWIQTSTKDRRTGLKAAWAAYRAVIKSARVTFKDARQAAWNVFYTSRKACGPQNATEDSTTQSVDNSL